MNVFQTSVPAMMACFALLAGFHQDAYAQTPISGVQTGTISAGVYNAVGNLSVPAGQTLTLDPGVIIKFVAGYEVQIAGTLIANGTASNPIIFTDDGDDTAGGDTNNNGPSVGVPASWRGLIFATSASASTLNYVEARYAGSSFVPGFTLNTCNATFTNCTSRDNYAAGMQLNSNSSPTVSNCTFTDNGGRAVDGVRFSGVPLFSNNSASGNSLNALRVTVGTVPASMSIATNSIMNGALMLAANISIPSGITLTMDAGVIVKFTAGYEVNVSGTLLSNGTASNPVIFTDDADDSAGGDTNNNGASVGVPAAWRGIIFQTTASNSILNYTESRWAGSSFVPAFTLNSSDITLSHCTASNAFSHGIHLNSNSFPSISNCAMLDCGGTAMEGVQMTALPGLSNNSAIGNGKDYMRITGAAVNSNLTIVPSQIINGVLMVSSNITVGPVATLTLQPDVIIKFTAGYEVNVQGNLTVNGTELSPVIFTDDSDDSAGGDTNNNGVSVGAPAAWRGIILQSTASASTLNYCEVRYAGSSFVAGYVFNSCNATLTNCTSRDCYSNAMHLNSNSFPTITACSMIDNGGRAMEGVLLAGLPGLLNNQASGNTSDYIRISGASVGSTLQIGTESVLNGALLVTANISVQAGGNLIVDQGMVFKFTAGYEVNVNANASIDLRGTTYEPIVFTDDADDDYGGDTNMNGASTGAPASWRGVIFNAGALASSLRNVIIRYCGSSFVPGVTCGNPNVTLESVRVDEAYSHGFSLSDVAGHPANLIAWSCGGHGFHLTNGGFSLVHATSAENNVGVRRENVYAGSVVNSIIYGNNTNFANFTGTEVLSCNGDFAGSNGNINADPLFVDPANGDLHLSAGSPSLNNADLAFGLVTARDHDENSRILDHNLTGAALPDMGAFELPVWGMTQAGDGRLGSTLTYTTTGPTGLSFFLFGALDGTITVSPYGIGLGGASLTVIGQSPKLVGDPLDIVVPPFPGLVGLSVGIESLTFPLTGGISVGNFTRLHRVLVRP